MKTMNECGFEQEQVAQAWSVGAMVLAMLALAVAACFTSGCTKDVYVDSSMEEDVFGENHEDDTSNPPKPEDDVSDDTEDAYSEGDCTGPWGCKQYADATQLPPECEDDDGCADGFVCNNEGECVPVMPEPDVSADFSGDTLEQQRYPLEIATQEDNQPEPECHCGVGYICEDGFCVKVGGNDNPPNDEPEPQPEPDVITQTEDVAPQPTEDVVAGGDSGSSFADAATEDKLEEGDVASQDASVEETDVVAEVDASSAAADAESPEVVADNGVAIQPFDGATCMITCPTDYTSVRIWWAFTAADVANGTEFKIPFGELCLWGEMAFEFNCFNAENGIWGDYLKVQILCTPADYEMEDTGIHGKVKFEKSCW
ncbi:MAG: hypothetical protein V1902_03855 [Candidatus Falkowbacteria bacterium]